MARTYLALGEDLVEFADLLADHFEVHGYKVKVEDPVMGAPFVATLTAKRGTCRIFIEVDSAVPMDRLDMWGRYCRSCSTENKIALAYVSGKSLSIKINKQLRDLGVGLYRFVSGQVIEDIIAMDLSLNIALPELKKLPVKLRPLLAPAYEQFEKSLWREGYAEACQALEVEARRHLKEGIQRKRLSPRTPKGLPRQLTATQINKMTLGKLLDVYQNLKNGNLRDATITKALEAIHSNRNRVTHHKRRKDVEARLRKNVGAEMWTIIAGLRATLGVD